MGAPTTASAVITEEVAGLKTELLLVAGSGLGVGVVILAVKRGWGFIKGFSRG